MSAIIISRPTKSGCNWNALGNPTIIRMQRQDQAFSAINNAGNARIQIVGLDVTAYFEVGNSVYFLTDNGNYNTQAEITVSAFTAGDTFLTLDIPYTTTGDSGIVNNLSKRTDYRVEYNFKSISGVKLIVADLYISASLTGIMLINASLLKNLISATWTLPVSVNEVDSTGSIEFYLSYQEYYDGALQGSVTNDSGNPIHGLLGSNQIGSADGSNMLAYFPASSSKKWLTRFYLNSVLNGLKLWRDWPFSLSFIHPDATPNLKLRVNQFNVANTELLTSISDINAANDNNINRILLPALFSTDVTYLVVKLLQATAGSFADIPIPSPDTFTMNWNNDDSGDNWTLAAAATIATLTGPGDDSKILSTAPTTPLTLRDVFYRITFDLTLPNTKLVTVNLYGFDVTWGFLGSESSVLGTGSPVSKSITSLTSSDASKTYTKFGIRIVSEDSVAGTITADNFAFLYSDVIPDVLTPLTIQVDDVCDYDEDNLPIPGQNPIMLQWKNSLGGDAFWMFPFYHEVSYNVKGYKAKRILLFAQDLSAVQWEAIQELNSANEIVRVPVIDLENTNTVISTSKQVGKQVYIMGKDGSKTGVVVIPNSDKITARDPSHTAAIEIELPEFFEA